MWELAQTDFARSRDERLNQMAPSTVKRELATVHHCLEVAGPENVRELVEAVTALASMTEPAGDTMPWEAFQGVCRVKLAELLGRDVSVISHNVCKAIAEGYLEDENAGQGRASKLFPAERKLLSGRALPLKGEFGEGGIIDANSDGSEALRFDDLSEAVDSEDDEEEETDEMPFQDQSKGVRGAMLAPFLMT